jgi:ATP-dependent Clp protease ATP-binding subunit ClpC
MFERWTDRARRSIVLAQEHARMMNHETVGTEHMLLGLVHEGDGVAFRALSALGVTLDAACAAAEKRRPLGTVTHSGHLPFTARGKKVCEIALREALETGVSYIGTEHVLLGIVREGKDTAAQVFGDLGVSLLAVRAKVLELLGGYERAEKAARAEPARRDEHMTRVRGALLRVHQETCERCASLALLCPACRESVGECPARSAIERLPTGEQADGG